MAHLKGARGGIVLKAMYRAHVAFLLLALFVYSWQCARAQIAPTNSATISGSVSDAAGKPVANAKVSLSGSKITSMQTDMQGLFVFIGVPFGAYQITVAAEKLGTTMRTISVQGDTNVAIQYEPASTNGLKTIAHVSSSANAVFNVTPASITQVNPIENAFEGKTSWRTILEQIPGVAQAGLGNGGSNVYASLPDSPFMPVQISINGALPYETAILLDDMPLIGRAEISTAGTGTDLGVYPLNAFGAADVVRGPGANAPSIVDSIGGSLVLHAPGMVNRNHYEFSVSSDPYGGIVANALASMRYNKLAVQMTYGVNDSPGPLNSTGIPARLGFTPSTINGRSFIPPSFANFGDLFAPGYSLNAFPLYGYQTGFLACCFDQSTAWSQHSGSIALTYAASAATSVELFYAGEISRMGVPRQEMTIDFSPPTGYAGSIPEGQHLFSCDSLYLAPQWVQQASSLLEEKITTQLGRGVLRLAALQNRTFSTFDDNTPSAVTAQLFGGGSLCSNTSPGCSTGTYAPVLFNGGTYALTLFSLSVSLPAQTDNRDLSLNYTVPLGQNYHLGASFVKSYYNMPSQEIISFSGIPIINSSVSSAISQVTKEIRFFVGGNLSERTSFDLSAYFINANYHVPNPNNNAYYSDATYTYAAPRLGFVWRPTASVAVRASAGGGFAEAPLQDLVGSNFIYSPTGAYYVQCAENINLQPEKSFAFDIGADFRLHKNDVLSLDVYRSNLFGQIYFSTMLNGTYLGLPLYTSEYGNLGASRYEGILLDVHHDVPHGLYWSISGGLTRGYLLSVPASFYNAAGGTCDVTTGANCTNLTVVPNINFNGQFAATIPYSQGLAKFGYRWSPDKYIDLTGTYYGNNNTYFRPAFVEFDSHLSYPIYKNASLLLIFRNMTNIYGGSTQVWALSNLSGAPTISGSPYPQYGEEYGPRTIIATLNFHT